MSTSKQGAEKKPIKAILTDAPKVPLSQRPIIILLTILIALCGGIPGIYNILNDKPKFEYINDGLIVFPTWNDFDTAHVHASFLISGSIANDGKKPLFPETYFGKIINEEDNIDYDLKIGEIDSTMRQFHSQNYTYSFDTAMDLTTVKKISATDAVYGNLVFVSSYPMSDFDFKKNLIFQITCLDIFGHKSTCQFSLKRAKPFLPKHFPRQGLKITPDQQIHFP